VRFDVFGMDEIDDRLETLALGFVAWTEGIAIDQAVESDERFKLIDPDLPHPSNGSTGRLSNLNSMGDPFTIEPD
jgi:hypothetical protein